MGSRALDAQVAEKVMGLKWDEARCRICGWRLSETIEQGCVKDNCSMRPMPSPRADEPAHYSTRIELAWPIIAMFRKRYPSDQNTRFFNALDSDQLQLNGAEEAAEYICLAALSSLPSRPGKGVDR